MREGELVVARAYTVRACAGRKPYRHVEALLRGGLELAIGPDALSELPNT